jgi:[ribosomal protein S5]-alanine N-acetyltransferase
MPKWGQPPLCNRAQLENLRREPEPRSSPPPSRGVLLRRGSSGPKMIILETERLLLREFVPEDVGLLSAVLSDPETMRYYPAPLDRTGVAEWIERNRRRYRETGHGLWALVLKSSGEVIGDCGLTRQTVDEIQEIELGYHLRRDLWGKGYASEAACACRDYGFAHLKVDQLISLVRIGNLPSRRVAEKVGMRLWKETVWRDLAHWVFRIRRTPH